MVYLTLKNAYGNLKHTMVHHNSYSKKIPKLSPLIAAAVIVVSVAIAPIVKADTYDDQINQLNNQKSQAQANSKALAVQAGDVQSQINDLQTQIASIQVQIDANTAEQTKLTGQINDAQKKLDEQRSLLSENIKAMYIEGDISPLEMIASSKNLGDFVDQQEYRDRIKNSISDTMDEITQLKKQLNDQKAAVQKILDSQVALQNSLDQKNASAQAMLAQVNQSKANFDASVVNLTQQIGQLRAAQAQMYANISGGGGSVPANGSYGKLHWANLTPGVRCGGGYPSPWCTSLDGYIDTWRLYSSECVSYAAWRMSLQHHVSSFHGAGMAYEFPYTAQGNGDAYVDSTPAAGSVVMIPPAMIGGVGHVAVVESVNGGWIHVSQYNWQPGLYSEMDIELVPGLVFAHFK